MNNDMSGDKVIDLVLMQRILLALVIAEDNALEVYNDHINKMGNLRRSTKDRLIEDHLHRSKNEAEELVNIIQSIMTY